MKTTQLFTLATMVGVLLAGLCTPSFADPVLDTSINDVFSYSTLNGDGFGAAQTIVNPIDINKWQDAAKDPPLDVVTGLPVPCETYVFPNNDAPMPQTGLGNDVPRNPVFHDDLPGAVPGPFIYNPNDPHTFQPGDRIVLRDPCYGTQVHTVTPGAQPPEQFFVQPAAIKGVTKCVCPPCKAEFLGINDFLGDQGIIVDPSTVFFTPIGGGFQEFTIPQYTSTNTEGIPCPPTGNFIPSPNLFPGDPGWFEFAVPRHGY